MKKFTAEKGENEISQSHLSVASVVSYSPRLKN